MDLLLLVDILYVCVCSVLNFIFVLIDEDVKNVVWEIIERIVN